MCQQRVMSYCRLTVAEIKARADAWAVVYGQAPRVFVSGPVADIKSPYGRILRPDRARVLALDPVTDIVVLSGGLQVRPFFGGMDPTYIYFEG